MESYVGDDNHEDLCLLKYQVNKTGLKSTIKKHKTLKNTAFV